MKLFRFTTLIAALAFVCAAPQGVLVAGAADEPRAITVATDATWPPMEMVDENKDIIGFDIDFFKAVAAEVGLEPQFQNTAWDGIFAGIAAGKYDAIISSVTITEERRKTMDFSTPYINAGQILIVPKTMENVTVLADLEGKKVGAQIGTTGAFEVKKTPGAELRSYDEIGLAFEDMAAGRIDAVVCDTPVAADYALQREEYKERFMIVGEPFTDEYYGIVVRKGNTQLLDRINRGIAAVQEKGIDEQLKEKWLR
ncbi:MAG: basic amino acid ABC transporter substrate-binding protein [Syntrophales bacterium]|jgi:polar amino acid transport system substrate-binding protein|nr:basic amino acid ABC transporter substrate-binding protein [Syntrophales bacterium]MCK9528389.1 basic amino acid ABC transporter substrate-binding protein [Syntrophales bacterium]MDX9922686.1 basic amino acid ABC transporter substrate-binding protein [Syntrophales bacterium]